MTVQRTPEERIAELARTFPSSLVGAPGIKPWEPRNLDSWAASVVSSGERQAACFILAVWDSGSAWDCGHFDLMKALSTWDEAHHRAFLTWAAEPWWP
ncbi:hypothetical protein [Tautonia sociabilis]|uniref:Uncharacterized protein n=1 Tax=Tautonia sociabilis TaxID=2080755 RepID=A0A432MEP4_9BACT|nr:hypothetical protein [Tautonia sociabilis]RUL84024.1 hypothetical protein TsocGM_21115 [Tautonia sociabilis]